MNLYPLCGIYFLSKNGQGMNWPIWGINLIRMGWQYVIWGENHYKEIVCIDKGLNVYSNAWTPNRNTFFLLNNDSNTQYLEPNIRILDILDLNPLWHSSDLGIVAWHSYTVPMGHGISHLCVIRESKEHKSQTWFTYTSSLVTTTRRINIMFVLQLTQPAQ